MWYAKAQSLVVVHRNWDDPNDYTTLIKVEKAKPRIVGKKGQVDLTYFGALGIYKDKYSTKESNNIGQTKEIEDEYREPNF